jgi:uncharacterized membrane protein
MDVRRPVEFVQFAFEAAGVLVLVLGATYASVTYGAAIVNRQPGSEGYQAVRQRLGRAILLGLEFLVAADIIRSVALDPSFASIGILGLLVVVRTFLSWSLEVEIDGVWPWQRSRSSAQRSADTGQERGSRQDASEAS